MKTALRKVSRPSSKEMVYVVSVDGKELGTISKFKDTRGTINPWKAWVGVPGTFAGCFYDSDGGKKKAIAVVCGAVTVS